MKTSSASVVCTAVFLVGRQTDRFQQDDEPKVRWKQEQNRRVDDDLLKTKVPRGMIYILSMGRR